jgi:trehalose synthase-fused probable maltokinase
VVAAGGDQSNTVVFANNQVMLKLFRRIAPSLNPEYEIGRYLTERGFTRIPALMGAVEYDRHGLEPGTLAVVQSAITHQGTGWQYTSDELRRYFERVAARPDAASPPPLPDLTASSTPPAFFDSLEHLYLTGAATLGRRTAELHLTLASSSSPEFAPEPCDRTALTRLADQMTEHGTSSLERLRGVCRRSATATAPSPRRS